MKTKLYILSIALCLFFMPKAQANHAFYVYQNTGAIDAFFTYEVDSIRYSNLDLDSVWHATSQVQEIWTKDSTYRIPLENIDSVSFITPETVYKDDVINISDNLMDYLIRCDSMTLFYRDDTPAKILPAVGAKLVFAEMNDIFPAGFAGEVIGVTFVNNEYAVECTDVSLTEVFETYYSVGSVYGYVDTLNQPQAMPAYDKKGDTTFTLEPYVWDVCDEFNIEVGENDELAIQYQKNISVTFTPTFHIKTLLIINSNEGIYFDYNIIGDFKVEERISFSGEISYANDLPLFTFEKPIVPYVNFYIQPGLTIDAKITASFEAYATQNFRLTLSDDISTKGKDVLIPNNNLRPTGHSFEAKGCAEGDIKLGAYIKLGIKVNNKKSDEKSNKELLDIHAQGTLGHQLVGGAVIYKNELDNAYKTTQLYEKLLASKLEYNTYGNITLQASVLDHPFLDYKLPCSSTKNIKTWNLAPSFRDVSFTDLGYSTDAKCTIEGLCLFPIECGYSVRNESNEEVDKIKNGIHFKEGSMPLDRIFDPYPVGSKYTLHPTIKWLGIDVLASPSAPLKEKEWVKITDFSVTDTIYDNKQNLEFEGEKYYYKHLADISVALQDNTGVVEWGYLYINKYGDSIFHKLSDYHYAFYTDHHSFYTNNAEDSVSLMGYAVFENGAKYIGNAQSYDLIYNHYCTDENHYHGVDLGLSSNIYWACCNLGANKPEEYGDYYAYGELETKEEYTERGYLYFMVGCYVPVGSGGSFSGDISGWEDDVVVSKWGNGWRMPTQVEMRELVNSCTWTWTTKNGIIGYQVTGPNGNSIFLPASGGKLEARHYAGDPDSWTWYRSSVMSSKQMGDKGYGYTYGIRFYQEDYEFSNACMKYAGYVIRPVKDKEQTSDNQ